MYDRKFDDQVLDFGHAGILYQQSFVMYDKQTNSLWVHVSGRAEEGSLKGEKLTLIPSTVTTWEDWRRRYPETLVLDGLKRQGFMGSYGAMAGRGDEVGLAVVLRGQARLYPYRDLRIQPLINDIFNGFPVLVAFHAATNSACVWERRVDGQVLTFKKLAERGAGGHPLFADDETGSHWSWLTGRAFSGPLKGRELQQLPSHPILTERFQAFYLDGEVFISAEKL